MRGFIEHGTGYSRGVHELGATRMESARLGDQRRKTVDSDGRGGGTTRASKGHGAVVWV